MGFAWCEWRWYAVSDCFRQQISTNSVGMGMSTETDKCATNSCGIGVLVCPIGSSCTNSSRRSFRACSSRVLTKCSYDCISWDTTYIGIQRSGRAGSLCVFADNSLKQRLSNISSTWTALDQCVSKRCGGESIVSIWAICCTNGICIVGGFLSYGFVFDDKPLQRYCQISLCIVSTWFQPLFWYSASWFFPKFRLKNARIRLVKSSFDHIDFVGHSPFNLHAFVCSAAMAFGLAVVVSLRLIKTAEFVSILMDERKKHY